MVTEQVTTIAEGAGTSQIVPARAAAPSGAATQVHALLLTSNSITLAWTPPTSGKPPASYAVFIRVAGTLWWSVGATSKIALATVTGLKPKTTYDIEVFSQH